MAWRSPPRSSIKCKIDYSGALGHCRHAARSSQLAFDRVVGIAPTFADLHASIDPTLLVLESVDPAALEARLERLFEWLIRRQVKGFRGDRFLTKFALPTFLIHLTLVYAIFRHKGVPLEIFDFMGQ